jgi:8-oxo-dGTP pyrophosphatase MutT (NUDIX family)
MKGMRDHKAAEREALEEAGIVGRIGKEPVGAYDYWKRGETAFYLCKVTVYPLEVRRQLTKWREKDERDTRWLGVLEAAALIEEPGLRAIIERLSAI